MESQCGINIISVSPAVLIASIITSLVSGSDDFFFVHILGGEITENYNKCFTEEDQALFMGNCWKKQYSAL